MKISAYKTDEKTGVTNSIDIEYDATNENERMDAASKIFPYAPTIFPFTPMVNGAESEESKNAPEEPRRDWALPMLLLLFSLAGS